MTDPNDIDAKLSAWWESIPGQRMRVKIARLERENEELRATMERLKAPVSDEEWKAQDFKGNQDHWRETFDEIIAARAKPGGTDAG